MPEADRKELVQVGSAVAHIIAARIVGIEPRRVEGRMSKTKAVLAAARSAGFRDVTTYAVWLREESARQRVRIEELGAMIERQDHGNLPCACEFDSANDPQMVRECDFHKQMRRQIQEQTKEIEALRG